MPQLDVRNKTIKLVSSNFLLQANYCLKRLPRIIRFFARVKPT